MQKEGCGPLRTENPGRSAKLQVSRAQLSEVGSKMFFLFGGAPSSLTSSRLKLPHTHHPQTIVDLTLTALHPGPSLASVSSASIASEPAAAGAQYFLPSPSIPSHSLPLLPELPPPRPRPLLGIPRLSVPPSILSASN